MPYRLWNHDRRHEKKTNAGSVRGTKKKGNGYAGTITNHALNGTGENMVKTWGFNGGFEQKNQGEKCRHFRELNC